MVDIDRLTAAMGALGVIDVMAALGECGLGGGRDLGFEFELPGEGEYPWQIQRFLNIEAVFQHVGEEIALAHGLIMAAHDAEGHDRAAGFGHHAGDDRVHRPLVRRDAVGMAALEAETEAAILQHDAGLAGENARAEALEGRVDQAAGIALFVDDAEIHRVAMLGQHVFTGAGQVGQSVIVIDQAAQPGQIGGA